MNKCIRLPKNFDDAASFVMSWASRALAFSASVSLTLLMFWKYAAYDFIIFNVGWVMIFSNMLFGFWYLFRSDQTDLCYMCAPLLAGFAAILCCSSFVVGAGNASANPFSITGTVGLLTVIVTYLVILVFLTPLAIYDAIFSNSSKR